MASVLPIHSPDTCRAAESKTHYSCLSPLFLSVQVHAWSLMRVGSLVRGKKLEIEVPLECLSRTEPHGNAHANIWGWHCCGRGRDHASLCFTLWVSRLPLPSYTHSASRFVSPTHKSRAQINFSSSCWFYSHQALCSQETVKLKNSFKQPRNETSY